MDPQHTLFCKTQTKQQFFVRLLLEMMQEKPLVKLMNQFCSESKSSAFYPFALLFVQKVTKFRRLREESDENIHECVLLFQKLKMKFFESSSDELEKYLSTHSSQVKETKHSLQKNVQEIATKLESALLQENKKVQTQGKDQSEDVEENLPALLPSNVFDELYVPLVNDMAVSLLPALLKSKLFAEFYEKNKFCSPSLKKPFFSKLISMNFTDPLCNLTFLAETRIREQHLIKEDDVVFLKMIDSTPICKEDVEQKGNVYVSQTNYDMELYGNGSAKLTKVKGSVPFDMQQVLDTLLSSQFRSMYDNSFIQQTVLEKYERPAKKSNKQYFETVITLESYPFTWPMHSRDFVIAKSVIRDEQNGMCFIVSKPAEHTKAPERKGTVRGLHYGGFVLKKISEMETAYTFISCTDFSCQTHNSEVFMNKFVTKRAKNFHSALTSYLQLMSTNTIGNTSIMQLLKSTAKQNTMSSIKITPGPVAIANVRRHESIVFNSTKATPSEEDEEHIGSSTLKRMHYYSLFTKKMTASELSAIEQVAKKINTQRNITGMLLYTADRRIIKNCKGIFYQVIEGEAGVIDALFAKLQTDKRHSHVKLISEETNLREIDRQYPTWSMECYNLDQSTHYFNTYMRELIGNIDRSLRPNDVGCCTIV